MVKVAILVLLAALGTTGVLGQSQDGSAPVRSGVDLVALNVVVVDKQQQFVTGLTSNNFAIYEDGIQQDVTFFAAQSFPVRDKDIIYVSTAPGADFQKFMNTVSSVAFSVIGIRQNL